MPKPLARSVSASDRRSQVRAQCTAFARDQGLPPILAPQAELLILGSMPSQASLAAAQYYAHPQNRFWPLWASLLGMPLPSTYDVRVQMLQQAGIAVWDVLAECERPGSLDAAIVPHSMRCNDIAKLLHSQPSIRMIGCNGGFAARTFAKHLLPQLPATTAWVSLPSTSPANARWRLPDLVQRWREQLQLG